MRIHVFDNKAWLFADDGSKFVHCIPVALLLVAGIDIMKASYQGPHCRACGCFLRPDQTQSGCGANNKGPHDVEVLKHAR